MMTNSILLLNPEGEQSAPRILDINQMEVLGRFGPFDNGLPSGWELFPDEGSWEIRKGCLHGRAASGNAAIFAWDQEIEGNHAIRFRGAAVKHEGETDEDVRLMGNLNCIWDYSGAVGSTFELTVAGFGGWYTGMSGIEMLGSAIPVAVRALSSPFALEADRVYEIFAGRVDSTKFLFADRRLAMALEVEPSVLGKTREQMRESLSRVGVSTWGREGGSEVRIESIEIYRIPEAAVQAGAP